MKLQQIFDAPTKIASKSRLSRLTANLLLSKGKDFSFHILKDLPSLLPKNSVLVINDSGTLPASFTGITKDNHPIEIRLVRNLSINPTNPQQWQAITFGDGSWRQKTEDRPSPPQLSIGDMLFFGDLQTEIKSIQNDGRFLEITFLGEPSDIWSKIYEYGKPIQYSHLQEELHIWDIQTIFSSIPVSMEAPSASFQFNWKLIQDIEKQGIEIIPITHATSISSTGVSSLDQKLPFPERYWISSDSAEKLNKVIARGKSITALGTSIVRALESNMADFGKIVPGQFDTRLKLTEGYQRKIVDNLITGMHYPTESHLDLLRTFISDEDLIPAYQNAIEHGLLWHEYGDLHLIVN